MDSSYGQLATVIFGEGGKLRKLRRDGERERKNRKQRRRSLASNGLFLLLRGSEGITYTYVLHVTATSTYLYFLEEFLGVTHAGNLKGCRLERIEV